MRAVVVGAGVVGLTTAVRLREAGIDANVVARDEPSETTSAVAAALWYPYRALPAERVTAWSAQTYSALAALADVAGSGVRMLAGTERLAPDAPDPWWREAAPSLERTREGLRFVAPAVDMSVHLPWLVARLRALGGTVERREVASLDDLEADAVVNCAGLGARELAGDDSLVAVRGQVVRVAAPEVREWLLDQSDPQRLVYVVPRVNDVVLGGTADEGAEDQHARPGDDGRDPRSLRCADPGAARRAGGRRRRGAAPRAPRRAPRGRGPRGSLLRPRRRRRDPRLGLRWGGSRTSRIRRPALRCPAVK